MLHEDRQLTSVSDMINLLKSDTSKDEVVWFRGQANKSWQLMPSLARKDGGLAKEKMLVKKFIQTASPYVIENIPKTTWDWIFLMQHYRVPTRLLDWTETPLVALYFAVCEQPTVDGVIWCLDPIRLNKEARLRFGYDFELPAFGVDDEKILNNYLPDKLEGGVSDPFPIAAIGQRNSKRMLAQAGTFTISHSKNVPIEEIGNKEHIWRYIIPGAKKAELLDELDYLGYSELKIFPELDNAGKHVAKMLG
jgi:hypothetical protein